MRGNTSCSVWGLKSIQKMTTELPGEGRVEGIVAAASHKRQVISKMDLP